MKSNLDEEGTEYPCVQILSSLSGRHFLTPLRQNTAEKKKSLFRFPKWKA